MLEPIEYKLSDMEIRERAMELAMKQGRILTTDRLIEEAKKIESYLRGEEKTENE